MPGSSTKVEAAIEVLVEGKESTVRDDRWVVTLGPEGFALFHIETEAFGGSLTAIRHDANCHVLDPTAALHMPHQGHRETSETRS